MIKTYHVKLTIKPNTPFNMNKNKSESIVIRYINCLGKHKYSEQDFRLLIEKAEIINEEETPQLLNLLRKFDDIFPETPDKYEQEIILNVSTPFFKKQYNMPFSQRAEVAKQINNMLLEGLIE